MNTILLLTDTPARGQRLARELGPLGACLTIDVLDPEQIRSAPPVKGISAVVSDVSLAKSTTIAGLRQQLDRFQGARVPFLCLLHENTSRSRLQADALGAARVLPADMTAEMLLSSVADLVGAAPVAPATPADVRSSVGAADMVLTRIFDFGRRHDAIEPELIATGAAFVERALRQTDIRAWLNVVWRFDDATHQHCLLVAGLAAAFANHLGLRRADCQRVTQAALLHDVGKSRIPPAILNKPGPLDEAERAIMRTHSAIGYEMLADGGFSDELLAVVRSHHEYLDGTGYPDGLKGDQIPDLVRIVTICDVFAALIERRPYKKPMSEASAYAIVEEMIGRLDGDLVRAFRPITDKIGGMSAARELG